MGYTYDSQQSIDYTRVLYTSIGTYCIFIVLPTVPLTAVSTFAHSASRRSALSARMRSSSLMRWSGVLRQGRPCRGPLAHIQTVGRRGTGGQRKADHRGSLRHPLDPRARIAWRYPLTCVPRRLAVRIVLSLAVDCNLLLSYSRLNNSCLLGVSYE